MTDLERREFLRLAGASALGVLVPEAIEPPGALAEAPEPARLGRRKLRELRRAVRGRVIAPGTKGYRRARRVYNRRFDRSRPDAVVRVAGVRDVKAVLDWADRHDVRVTARSGGHSYAGYSTTDKGVVIDLRRMRDIRASRAKRSTTIEAGAQLIDVYAKLARRGMTVPAGSCPSVGIAGLALGGGMGLASRKLGLTCDNVSALTIVTADGRVRDVDARRDPDLFWACRGGGGGNFGVVTSLTLDTHRVRRAAYFFVSWPWSEAAAALDAWQDFAPGAPAALTSIFSLQTGTRSPTVSALGQFFGSEQRLRRLLRPLRRVAGARVTVGSQDYLGLMLRWAGCLDEGLRACHTRGTAPGGRLSRAWFDAKSDYVGRRLDSRGRRRLVRAIERRQGQSGSGALLLDAYGGAINRVHPEATAFVHRDQLYSIQYLAYYPEGGRRAASRWLEEAHGSMRRHVSGEAYQNYIDPQLGGWKRAYYGRNYARLVDVKTKYDPENRFRFRQGIPPRG